MPHRAEKVAGRLVLDTFSDGKNITVLKFRAWKLLSGTARGGDDFTIHSLSGRSSDLRSTERLTLFVIVPSRAVTARVRHRPGPDLERA